MAVMPGMGPHPGAARSVKVRISLAPADARAPRAPSPAAPLTATAVISGSTICFGAVWREGDHAGNQCEGHNNLVESGHRQVSGAATAGQVSVNPNLPQARGRGNPRAFW